MKGFLILLIFSLSGQFCLAKIIDDQEEKKPLVIGEKMTFYSDVLQENRQLNIYLPNGYHPDSSKTYPIIYLLDGSMDEDFIHISGLVQFGSFSWIDMLPETIVVGIANVDRKRDFTFPTSVASDKADFPTTGGSEKFIQFIENELKKQVELNYKSNGKSTLIGQSLGGLLASEILLTKPELFDRYVIVSPSLWWDNKSLLEKTPSGLKNVKGIYISVGKEGRIMQRTAKALYKKIKKVKPDQTMIRFKYFKAQNHGDALHLSVYDAFEHIFNQRSDK